MKIAVVILLMFSLNGFAGELKPFFTTNLAKKMCYRKGLKTKKDISNCIEEIKKDNSYPGRQPAKK